MRAYLKRTDELVVRLITAQIKFMPADQPAISEQAIYQSPASA